MGICWLAQGWSDGADWLTLHGDSQRSGYSAEILHGPFERKWYRDFHEEGIATRVEAMVAGGLCYVGTYAGRVHALDVADGRTVWTFATGGPIGAAGHIEEGKLLVGSDDGHLYCLDRVTGELMWRYRAAGGVWVAPAGDGERVYFGDRAGGFHAVDLRAGRAAWTYDTEGMILTPASITRDGRRIVFAGEDMRVYCLDPSGRLQWRSEVLPGLSLRDHAPTLWQGLALVRSNPADGFHVVMDRNGHVLKGIQQEIPLKEGEEVLLDKWNDYMVTPSPERRRAEQDGVTAYLKEHPHDRTLHALRLNDGRQPWIAPVFYTGGLHNPPTAPTFDPETGELYLFYRSALSTYVRGVRRYAALGRLDPDTGRIDWSWPETQAHDTWYAMPMIGDETQALSLMGPWLLGTHQGMLAALHRRTGRLQTVWDGRDTYGGIFGPGALAGGFEAARELASQGFLTGLPHEWHGPDRSIVALADKRLFWVVGSQVVCLAGPEIPATDSGGMRPPAPFPSRLTTTTGGNVVSGGPGGYDESRAKRALSPEAMGRVIRQLPSRSVGKPAMEDVHERLEREVAEWVEQGTWAPLIVQLGISGSDRYFWRTAETIQIVSLALPYLKPPLREAARARLRALVRAGAPMHMPVHDAQGRRREPYGLGPGMQRFADRQPNYEAALQDVYALWAYGYFTEQWEDVIPQMNAVEKVFQDGLDQPLALEDLHAEDGEALTRDTAEKLNGRIGGLLGYARLMDRAGRTGEVARAESLLANLVAERVHHEEADTRLIRPTRTAEFSLHQAKVPRYLALIPELGGLLREHAGDALAENLSRLTHDLPVWHHAFGERMIGGENYISPPHLARGIFMALADGGLWETPQLEARLDEPWGKADLYFIEKCTAILRRQD